MLASGLDTLRLTLHVLAASIWVGGQIVMVGLVGPARASAPTCPPALARAFARLAWPAYAVLVVTGFWNISTLSLGGPERRLEGGPDRQDRGGGRWPEWAPSSIPGPPPGPRWRCGDRWPAWPAWPRWSWGSFWPGDPAPRRATPAPAARGWPAANWV